MKAWGTLTLAAASAAVLLAVAGCTGPVTSAGPTSTSTTASSCVGAATVSTAAELRAALDSANPGDSIVLASGTYGGDFSISRSGTESAPITLCGPRDAILAGGSLATGTTLHLDGVIAWTLTGFAVTGGQKGVLLDGSSANTISGLSISGVGHEALHLRAGSTDNTVEGTQISDTGKTTAKFGEGIYVGSAESNWCSVSGCEADRSDRNIITGNSISATTAENIDIKEGTTGGELRGNLLDGSGTTAADSLIDMKGTGWTVANNMGTGAPTDGAQVHVILSPWGSGNTFSGNQFAIPSDGYIVDVVGDARSAGNIVACDNGITPAASSTGAGATTTGSSLVAGDGVGANGPVGAGGTDPRVSTIDCT